MPEGSRCDQCKRRPWTALSKSQPVPDGSQTEGNHPLQARISTRIHGAPSQTYWGRNIGDKQEATKGMDQRRHCWEQHKKHIRSVVLHARAGMAPKVLRPMVDPCQGRELPLSVLILPWGRGLWTTHQSRRKSVKSIYEEQQHRETLHRTLTSCTTCCLTKEIETNQVLHMGTREAHTRNGGSVWQKMSLGGKLFP